MYRLGALLLIGLVGANDLAVGPTKIGQKVFDEQREASPAIWRQCNTVTINATDDQVINSVEILDLRPLKDGDANIVDGGIGHQNVTIELKSPAVFRGYNFQIQVYAVPKSQFQGVLPEDKQATSSTQQPDASSQHTPILIADDKNENIFKGDSPDIQGPNNVAKVFPTLQSTETTEKSSTIATNFDEFSTTPKNLQGSLDDDQMYLPKGSSEDKRPSTDVTIEPTGTTTVQDLIKTEIKAPKAVIDSQDAPITNGNDFKRVGRENEQTKVPALVSEPQAPVLTTVKQESTPKPITEASGTFEDRNQETIPTLQEPKVSTHVPEDAQKKNQESIPSVQETKIFTDNSATEPQKPLEAQKTETKEVQETNFHEEASKGFPQNRKVDLKPLPYINH